MVFGLCYSNNNTYLIQFGNLYNNALLSQNNIPLLGFVLIDEIIGSKVVERHIYIHFVQLIIWEGEFFFFFFWFSYMKQ